MKRIQIIDFLKGYSILTIVIFHCFQNLELNQTFINAIKFGGTGVHLFIFLSGYGLYSSHLRKPISYLDFIKRRFSNVYIPYIIIVLVSATISFFIPLYKNSLYGLGGHILLYKMFDETIIDSYGYQLSFISTIIQFYFTFYILIWIKKRLRLTWFIIFGILVSLIWSTIVYLTHHSEMRVWNSFFLQYLWEFILGVSIAERVYDEKFNYKIKNVHCLLLGIMFTCVFGILALKGGEQGKVFNDIPALLGYSFLALFVYQLNFNWLNRFLIFTGKISYSLYLTHILVLFAIKYFLSAYNVNFSYLGITLTLCLSYLIAIGYNKLVERLMSIFK